MRLTVGVKNQVGDLIVCCCEVAIKNMPLKIQEMIIKKAKRDLDKALWKAWEESK